MITLHPEATDDPATLRWVVPAGLVPAGRPLVLPAALAELGEAVQAVDVRADGIWVTLGPGHSWRADGRRVRAALAEALDDPDSWQVDAADPDAVLAETARAVLAGPTGDYIASHGGVLRVTGARGGVLELASDGTCASCPALDLTLQVRVAREVRRRFPGLVDVRIQT